MTTINVLVQNRITLPFPIQADESTVTVIDQIGEKYFEIKTQRITGSSAKSEISLDAAREKIRKVLELR